jgi:hypothetical protein
MAFTSTTRPTSGGTGTPAATSLITLADGDGLYVGLAGDQTVAGTKTFQQIKIPGPYADDIEAAIAGVLDDRLYFQPEGSVVANVANHLSLDLQFADDKTLTARKGPTPVFTRASTATFIGSDGLIQSAAINAPRFDHDPVTLDCKGLLIEESRTNAIIQSDTLATQTITVTAAARTLSFYGTGTVVLSGAHSATVVGTGAFPTRTTLTFTPSAGSLTLTVTGSVTQAQLEVGAFATSYIPTTTAPVVRSQDICSITGADFTGFYNQSEGSLSCNYSIPAGFTGNRYAASIEDTTGGTQNGFIFRNTNVALSFIAGGGYTSTIGATTTTVDKHILAYSGLTEFVYVKNSVVGTTTGSGTRDPSLPIRMSIGTLEGFNGFSLCGHIAAIRYFKKRLTNEKLETLTS